MELPELIYRAVDFTLADRFFANPIWKKLILP